MRLILYVLSESFVTLTFIMIIVKVHLIVNYYLIFPKFKMSHYFPIEK